MTREFLKLVYTNLKNQFEGISKKSWIIHLINIII